MAAPEKQARTYRALDGVLLFDKPLHLSSNIAMQKVRRLFQAVKAGHTGTLDPLATGLLPICFGEATKFSTALLEADKSYRALLRLGQTTSTGDAEGEITSSHPVEVRQAQLDAVLANFRGEISQLPPMHSALKHQGKPLYEYIRKGVTIERETRRVLIHELVQNSFESDPLPSQETPPDLAVHRLDLSVRCSKGTYIRTLAEDIGAALGCGAHLIGLRRSSIAHYDVRDSYSLEQLEAMSDAQRLACILPLESLMPASPWLYLDAIQLKRMAQGQRLAMDLPDGRVCLQGEPGFVGVGILQGGRLSVVRLLSCVAKRAAAADMMESG